jgi:hypothetical protein
LACSLRSSNPAEPSFSATKTVGFDTARRANEIQSAPEEVPLRETEGREGRRTEGRLGRRRWDCEVVAAITVGFSEKMRIQGLV